MRLKKFATETVPDRLTSDFNRLVEAAEAVSLLNQPQPLGILPTYAYWKRASLGWLSMPMIALLWGVVWAVAAVVDVGILGTAAIMLAVGTLYMGVLERFVRHRLRKVSLADPARR